MSNIPNITIFQLVDNICNLSQNKPQSRRLPLFLALNFFQASILFRAESGNLYSCEFASVSVTCNTVHYFKSNFFFCFLLLQMSYFAATLSNLKLFCYWYVIITVWWIFLFKVVDENDTMRIQKYNCLNCCCSLLGV